MSNGPIIHNGVVLHGIKMAENSTISPLVTSQVIIPIVPIVPIIKNVEQTSEEKKS